MLIQTPGKACTLTRIIKVLWALITIFIAATTNLKVKLGLDSLAISFSIGWTSCNNTLK